MTQEIRALYVSLAGSKQVIEPPEALTRTAWDLRLHVFGRILKMVTAGFVSGPTGNCELVCCWPAVVSLGGALPIAGFGFWLSDRRKNVSAWTA
jgi:hypothetical protein